MKLLDFYSDNCGPCKMMDPILSSIADAISPVVIEKINVLKESNVAAKYGVTSIPTFILINGDKELGRRTGAVPRPTLIDWIKSYAE